MYDLILLGHSTVHVNANLSKLEKNFTIDVRTNWVSKNRLDFFNFYKYVHDCFGYILNSGDISIQGLMTQLYVILKIII